MELATRHDAYNINAIALCSSPATRSGECMQSVFVNVVIVADLKLEY